MKRIVSGLIFLIFLFPQLCHARLGENVMKNEIRYGRPIARQVLNNGREQRAYRDNRYNIWIEYENNIAVAISYQLTNRENMSIKRMEELFSKNGSEKSSLTAAGRTALHTWYLVPSGIRDTVQFIERGGEASATYSLSGNILTFRVH